MTPATFDALAASERASRVAACLRANLVDLFSERPANFGEVLYAMDRRDALLSEAAAVIGAEWAREVMAAAVSDLHRPTTPCSGSLG